MNEIITIGPVNYQAKIKEHVQPANEESALILRHAQELTIKDDETLRAAKEDWVAIRTKLQIHEDDRKSVTVPLNDILGQVNAGFKTATVAWTTAREILNKKVQEYNQKKEQDRQEAERKAQEAARKEEERIRKEKEAQEAAWRAKEEAAKREIARLEAEAAKAKNEAARAKAEEAAAKARAEAEKAAAKAAERAQEAQSAFVPAPTIEKVVTKVAGAKMVTRYFFKILKPELVPVEWNGKMLRPVDDKALGEIARGMKLDGKKPSPIPGVQFWSEEKMG